MNLDILRRESCLALGRENLISEILQTWAELGRVGLVAVAKTFQKFPKNVFLVNFILKIGLSVSRARKIKLINLKKSEPKISASQANI